MTERVLVLQPDDQVRVITPLGSISIQAGAEDPISIVTVHINEDILVDGRVNSHLLLRKGER